MNYCMSLQWIVKELIHLFDLSQYKVEYQLLNSITCMYIYICGCVCVCVCMWVGVCVCEWVGGWAG